MDKDKARKGEDLRSAIAEVTSTFKKLLPFMVGRLNEDFTDEAVMVVSGFPEALLADDWERVAKWLMALRQVVRDAPDDCKWTILRMWASPVAHLLAISGHIKDAPNLLTAATPEQEVKTGRWSTRAGTGHDHD